MADTRVCIYEGCIVVGTFADLEEHATDEHGAKRLALYCSAPLIDTKPCERIFRSIEARRAHYKKWHGWG